MFATMAPNESAPWTYRLTAANAPRPRYRPQRRRGRVGGEPLAIRQSLQSTAGGYVEVLDDQHHHEHEARDQEPVGEHRAEIHGRGHSPTGRTIRPACATARARLSASPKIFSPS